MDEITSAEQIGYEAGYALGGVLGCFFMVAIPVLFIVSLILAIVRKSKGWTIATVILGVLGLAAVVAAVVFSAGKVAEVIEEQKVPKEFTSSDGLVTITGPGSWSDQDLGHPDSELEIGNLFGEEYLMVISEPKSDFEEGFSLDQFADLAGEGMIGVLEEPDYSELEALNVNSLPALRHRLNGTIDGIRIAYVNTFIEGKEHFHQVLAWTLEESQETAIPKLEKAADTFREAAP